jgi:DNA end-binding protein Ku
MSGKWNPEKYKDDYRSALMKLIEEKIRLGGKLPAARGGARKKPSNVIDLVSVLQESIKQSKQDGKQKKKAAAPKRPIKKAA